jgi:hypothetical protein
MQPEPQSTTTLCGHPEHSKGHCGVEDCLNRWQICAGCNPAAAGSTP